VTRIKITSAPQITARLIRKDNVTFANGCSLFISTNYRPQVRETDHGTWRRLEGLIPYPYTFRKAHERLRDDDDRWGDATLRQRIAADEGGDRARAMLAWLIEGAMRWYAGEPGRAPMTMGQPPQRVSGELAEWREVCDLLHGWLAEAVEFDREAHVLSADALAAFNEWARGRGHERWSAELFAARMAVHSEVREHGVWKKRGVRRGDLGLPSRPSWMNLEPYPEQYVAWLGMRFKSVSAGGTGVTTQTHEPHMYTSRNGIYGGVLTPITAESRNFWQAMWSMADKNPGVED
jgi:putative DNA primase/helicase